MERHSRKDEEGKSENSDKISDGVLEGLEDDEDEERRHSKKKNLEDDIPLMKRVSTQRFLDLGVPGGYEQYNYKEAYKVGQQVLALEKEVKDRVA